MGIRWIGLGFVIAICTSTACTEDDNGTPDGDSEQDSSVPLPVQPQIFLEGVFTTSEGIAFNDEGRLFVTADKGVYEVLADGTTIAKADLTEPVGLAHDGEGNMLVADWGDSYPTLGQNGPTLNDGVIVRVSPEGEVENVASGIPDPNFIALWPDGSYLVSDDLDRYIYKVDKGSSTAEVWLDSVVTPNGLAFSKDSRTLYVCQTFAAVGSMAPDNRVWTVPIDEKGNPGEPEILAELETGSALDGIALDDLGRVYVAANLKGTIWRIDPKNKDTVIVARGVPSVASLAFGRGGDFPKTSLYLTSLFTGTVYRLDLGVEGVNLP